MQIYNLQSVHAENCQESRFAHSNVFSEVSKQDSEFLWLEGVKEKISVAGKSTRRFDVGHSQQLFSSLVKGTTGRRAKQNQLSSNLRTVSIAGLFQ